HRLAGDEQVHDLARALEDEVDPEVAHDALDRHGFLPPRPQRVRGLVAATAADLYRLVDDAPAGLGVVQLRDRRLEPDVVAAAVRHRREDRKSTRLNSSHVANSYPVFC